jgi:hypothetical protein
MTTNRHSPIATTDPFSIAAAIVDTAPLKLENREAGGTAEDKFRLHNTSTKR